MQKSGVGVVPGQPGAMANVVTSGMPGAPPPVPYNPDIDSPVPSPLDQAATARPDGGAIQTVLAQPNGSRMQPPDMNSFVQNLVSQGLTGDALASRIAAGINEAQQYGLIDRPTAVAWLASYGRGEMLSSDTTLAQQAMVTGGQIRENARQFDQTPRQVINPQDVLTSVPQNEWYKNYRDYRAVDANTAGMITQHNLTPTTVHKVNPDGSLNPNETEVVTRAEAIRTHRQPAEADFHVTGPGTSDAEKGSGRRDQLLERATQEMYPVKESEGFLLDDPRTEVSQLSPEAKAAVNERALEEFNRDPKLRVNQKNFGEAQKRAMASLQKDGYLDTPDKVTAKRQRGGADIGIPLWRTFGRPLKGTDPALVGSGKKDDAGRDIPAFKIDLLKPYPLKEELGTTVFNKPGTINPTGGPTAPPPTTSTSAGVQVQNPREGEIHFDQNGGPPMIVHNGVAVPLNAKEKQDLIRKQREAAAGAR